MSDIALTGLEAMFFAIVLGVSAGTLALITLFLALLKRRRVARALGWAAVPLTLGGLGLLVGSDVAAKQADAWAFQVSLGAGVFALLLAVFMFIRGAPVTAPAK